MPHGSSGQLFGVDLAAQREAFAADGGVGAEFPVRIVERGCESADSVSVFAAEAAATGSRGSGDCLEGSDPGSFAALCGDDRVGGGGTGLADGDAGSGDELARLALRTGAERAVQLGRRALPSAPAARPAGRFDDLVDALMAQLQLVGELA